jgi:1-acyl-sn-glycerol-3-phosphate acyltransferase
LRLFATLRALLIIDPLIILNTIIYGIWNATVSLYDKSGDRQVAIARLWARMLMRVSFVKLDIEGLENIDPKASYVFASNHLSYFDTPCILAGIPNNFRFIAKVGLFSIPFLGYHLKKARHIAVPRDNPREAIKTLAEAGRVLRERGISVLIFPEGGRAPDAKLQQFRDGGFVIAMRGGVPVVPVALEGSEKVLPFGSGTVSPGHVILRIGKPIPTKDLTIKDREGLSRQCHDAIAAMLSPHMLPDDQAGSSKSSV